MFEGTRRHPYLHPIAAYNIFQTETQALHLRQRDSQQSRVQSGRSRVES